MRRALFLVALAGSLLVPGLAWASAASSPRPAGVRPQAPPVPGPVLHVRATAQTDPVPHRGDAADDPAIWLHPTDPSQSTIVATDKKGGLAVYDLAGRQIQYLADGELNNVDLRDGFVLGGQTSALVVATNRSSDSLAVYRIDVHTRQLVNAAGRTLRVSRDAYGACLYRSALTGQLYVFVTSKNGVVQQWELFDDGRGLIDARNVRAFDVGRVTEGCVADDQLGHLYVAEEEVGIWKYDAEPEAGTERMSIDSTRGGYLKADVEGLALYQATDGTGYLIASSQGSDSFVVYRREGDNAYVLTFQVIGGDEIDGISGTDGIDVTSASLGPAFPYGLFVAQDGQNRGGNQNFKLVPWEGIAGAASPPLTIAVSPVSPVACQLGDGGAEEGTHDVAS